MATTNAPITDDDLLRLPRDGRKYELVDGAIRVSPAGTRHGQISLRLGARLLAFVEPRGLGHVLESSTGFRLPGGNLRCPDVSYVSRGRFGPGGRLPSGFAELAPDIAVEVLSPSDDVRQVLDKLGEYLRAGVQLVWLIDPVAERAAAYRSSTAVLELGLDDELDGADVLPGFRCSLRELLAD